MKKTIYLRCLFAHLALMALGGALTAAMVFCEYDLGAAHESPLWALLAPAMAAAAYLAGRKLRADGMREAGAACWNAAMVLYALSLLLLALLWKLPESAGARLANVWNFPTAPVLAGLNSAVGHLHVNVKSAEKFTLLYRTENYRTLILPVLGALSAAVEPMALTLGFLGKPRGADKNLTEENEEGQGNA